MNGKFPFRAWYYFRIGYFTYLAFVFAAINTLVTVYYLAIKNVPALEVIFSSFALWSIVIAITVAPLGVLFGWLHLKRSSAYRSEMDLSVESNPYYYKLPPGYWREAVAPVMLELLTLNLKSLKKEQVTDAEINSLQGLQTKLRLLIDGGYVGEPSSRIGKWK